MAPTAARTMACSARPSFLSSSRMTNGLRHAKTARCSPASGVGRTNNVGRRRGAVGCNAQLGLIMSTMTGHTAEYADTIKEKMGDACTEPIEVAELDDMSSLKEYDGYIVGAPTWHTGADEQRSGTAWDDVLAEIAGMDLAGKPCAVFGCGDSAGYSDNFCDAIEEIHDTFSKAGCKLVGYVPAGNYDFGESKSVRDGKFLGLPLDYENEDEMSEDRITEWCEQIKAEMGAGVAAA